MNYTNWSFEEILAGSSKLSLVDWIMQIPKGSLDIIWRSEIGDSIQRVIFSSNSPSSILSNTYSKKYEELNCILANHDGHCSPSLAHRASLVAICILVLGGAADCSRLLTTYPVYSWLNDWITANLAVLQEATLQQVSSYEQIYASPCHMESLLANIYMCTKIMLLANLYAISPSVDDYKRELIDFKCMLIACLRNISDCQLASLLAHPSRRSRLVSVYCAIVKSGICGSDADIETLRPPSDGCTIHIDDTYVQNSLSRFLCSILFSGEIYLHRAEILASTYPWILEVTSELIPTHL